MDAHFPAASDLRNCEVKKIVMDGMLDRMEQAFPGSSSKVVLSELGTPATQTRFVDNTAGAPFGLQLRLSQTGPMRPRDTTPIPELFTVGTSTAGGPGTVGSMFPTWNEDFDPCSTTRALHRR